MRNERAAIKNILAGNIKKYRARLKLTQERASEKADLPLKYWQRLEMLSQEDLPSLQMLFKIARGLGINPSKLLDS